MSFYSDASLVMIPSGYKTSKVYSAVPTDGSGDLVFSRSNDTATRVGPDGLIEKVRTNVLLQSNTFSTTWATADTSVTGGQAGYDGTNNAWLLDITGGTVNQRIVQSVSLSGLQIFSIYAKAGTLGWIRLRCAGASSPDFYFDLVNGVLGSGTGSGRIEAAGNGFYRCSIFVDNATTEVRIHLATDNGNITQSSGNIIIQNAQFETGDIATDYIATTTAAVSVGPVANVPRLDYLNSSCPRLLLEPQRTNLALYSEQINNAAWIKGNSPTITTNIATAPDGTTSADGIQDTTGGTYKTISQNISLSANTTLTLSFFVKKETSETAFGGFAIYFQGGTAKIVYGIVNAVTGAVTYASSTLTPTTKVEDYGTYWRIASSATDNGSNTLCGISYYGTLSANGTALSPAIGSVRTVWGFQAEVGAYATSYIPTLGAAVTRGADAASKTGISSLIGQTEGTLFVEVDLRSTSSTKRILYLSDGGANNEIRITSNAISVGDIQYVVRLAGTLEVNLFTPTNVYTNGVFKIAAAYKENDFVFYINGVQVGTDTSGGVPTCNRIDVGSQLGTGAFLDDRISQALLFKTRLDNATLAALTA